MDLLDERRIDVWHLQPEDARDPALLSAYWALLSTEEKARSRRFVFERDRHRHVVTRVLVRAALSRYAPVEPACWNFRENDYGRPEIAGPVGAGRLRFNVSHTTGFIVCGVGLERDFGLDVEDLRRSGPTFEIANRYFSPIEVEDLRRQPPGERATRFLEYWTLKEAYIKARGMGLSIPLEQFSFHIGQHGPIRISFDPQLDDDPGGWHFELLRPSRHHVLAVAARRCGVDFVTVLRPCIPLLDESRLPLDVSASQGSR